MEGADAGRATRLGPILRYDSVVNGVWHGFALLVTSDQGSTYEPGPLLLMEWASAPSLEHEFEQKAALSGDLASEASHGKVNTCSSQSTQVFSYLSNRFFRFKLEIPLGDEEQEIFYSVNVSAPASYRSLGSRKLKFDRNRAAPSCRFGCRDATRTYAGSRIAATGECCRLAPFPSTDGPLTM